MQDDFHMAHLNRYGPSLNDNIKKVAFLIFFWLPTPSEVSLSRIVSPNKAVFRAFFLENHVFDPFGPMKTPKCYTWLESCGSHLSGGIKEKIFFSILQSVRFSRMLRTDIFLYTEKLSYMYTEGTPGVNICPQKSRRAAKIE